MPLRKDYPPASRSSARLLSLEDQLQQTAAARTPLPDDSDRDKTQEDQSDETDSSDKTLEQTPGNNNQDNDQVLEQIPGTLTQDNVLPSIEKDEQEPEFTDAREQVEEQSADAMDSDEIRKLRQRIAELETAQDNNTRSHREQSAFAGSGTGFKPKNMAAWPAFAPYEGDNGKNPNYSANEKKRAEAPPKFVGKKTEFDSWLTKLADKFEEDDCTFRTEKSRMRYVRGLLEGKAEDSIATRYTSTTRPYVNVAEMIQALESSFYDPNQSLSCPGLPQLKQVLFSQCTFRSSSVKLRLTDNEVTGLSALVFDPAVLRTRWLLRLLLLWRSSRVLLLWSRLGSPRSRLLDILCSYARWLE